MVEPTANTKSQQDSHALSALSRLVISALLAAILGGVAFLVVQVPEHFILTWSWHIPLISSLISLAVRLALALFFVVFFGMVVGAMSKGIAGAGATNAGFVQLITLVNGLIAYSTSFLLSYHYTGGVYLSSHLFDMDTWAKVLLVADVAIFFSMVYVVGTETDPSMNNTNHSNPKEATHVEGNPHNQ